MELNDILSGGSQYVAANRPVSLDMDRIMDTVLEMKAEAGLAPAVREKAWTERITALIDYDALAWQALQVGFDLFGVKDGMDLMALRMSRERNAGFIRVVQAFYDGFILGAEFEQRGGHRG